MGTHYCGRCQCGSTRTKRKTKEREIPESAGGLCKRAGRVPVIIRLGLVASCIQTWRQLQTNNTPQPYEDVSRNGNNVE